MEVVGPVLVFTVVVVWSSVATYLNLSRKEW